MSCTLAIFTFMCVPILNSVGPFVIIDAFLVDSARIVGSEESKHIHIHIIESIRREAIERLV